jgi:hypothetical protein
LIGKIEELSNYIDKENLPKDYGGTSDTFDDPRNLT